MGRLGYLVALHAVQTFPCQACWPFQFSGHSSSLMVTSQGNLTLLPYSVDNGRLLALELAITLGCAIPRSRCETGVNKWLSSVNLTSSGLPCS